MTFQSAYLKLTMMYVLIVMFISICFSVVLFRLSSNELNRGLVRQTHFIRALPGGVAFSIPVQDIENNRAAQFEESSGALRHNLIYFNLFILVLSSVASYFLAKRTLRPIEEMVEAQNRFTADASHELRTPLTAMRTEIEVALRGGKMGLPEAKQLLASNLEEISKLESLAGALLKLAKYREDVAGSFVPVPLSETIVEAYEKVEGLAHAKSIAVTLDSDHARRHSGKPEIYQAHPESDSGQARMTKQRIAILGDHISLVELFVILLDNAIKYSPNHSRIEISVTNDEKLVRVTVRDHGIGIKASDLPYIFNRFYRADNSRSKETTPGYGLGLAIAKQIVELHHGEISAISIPGKGSEVTVILTRV